jgi:hypothetical protein
MDLLRAEEPSECDDTDEEARKVEALEELNGMVTMLQEGGAEACMSCVEAAATVRRKAKDDVASREMLPMLGAILLLVVMLNDSGKEVTAAVLYALLNLGVGNDPVAREFFLCAHVLPFLCFVISISDRSLVGV